MKFRKLKPTSARGKLLKECDKLFAMIIKVERGPACEIHGGLSCDRIGTMHILSKQAHPRLRYCPDNVVRACWFGSHFWTHHNPDDCRAIRTKQRILQIKGCKTWGELKMKLLVAEKSMQKHDILYLNALRLYLKNEIEKLVKESK